MSTTFQIAEVARRSGFTPATLRFYEDIGLLAPRGRTDAGYRVYDETSLDRLRFIARAKQLGCSLDEIADLATAWDGGTCATVQARLRSTVEAKIAAADSKIAELAALTADLRDVAVALAAEPVDGPCDDTCACTTGAGETAPVRGPVPPVAKPDADPAGGASAVPIACTLGAGELASRVDEWKAVLGDGADARRGVTARRALADGGLRLEFGPGADVTEIARLAAAEQGCCAFFTFALVIDGRGVALEVHASADGRPVLTALFGTPGRPSTLTPLPAS